MKFNMQSKKYVLGVENLFRFSAEKEGKITCVFVIFKHILLTPGPICSVFFGEKCSKL
jgi:hypothetical protein